MKPSSSGPKLTREPEGRAIRSLMLPMLLGMIALISYNIADTYFVGQLGTLELAALSFTFPVSFIVGAITMGFGIGTASVCARLFGAEQLDDVGRVTIHAILLGVLTGAAVIALGLATIDPLFTLLGADDTTLPIIRRYMRIYYWGGIFLVVPMITNSVLRASGDAKTPAKIMTTAALINIVLDPILIFGLFGFPRLEVEGAAIATVVANAGTMLASIYAVWWRDHLLSFASMSLNKLTDSWRRILHVGLPSMASSMIAPLTTGFITYQVAQFGQPAVAGFGVASRVEGLSILALMALSASVTPFVGQNYGAKRYDRVSRGIAWCFRFSLIYGLSSAAVIAVSASYIAHAFTDNETALNTAQLHMRIVPISYLALGFAVTANSAFNGLGKPIAAMLISLTRTILVYAPLAFLLAYQFGLVGVFAAACIANFVAGTVGAVWLSSSVRRLGSRTLAPSHAEA